MTAETSVRVVLTGGPGSGKTTLLHELRARGYPTVPEAGRAVIQDQLTAASWPPWRTCPWRAGGAVRTRDACAAAYEEYGYELLTLPYAPVAERADHVLAALDLSESGRSKPGSGGWEPGIRATPGSTAGGRPRGGGG